MNVLGIDPGLNGGIAIIDGSDVIELCKMPTVKSASKGNELDYKKIFDLINESNVGIAFVEKSQAMPTDGGSSAFKYGGTYYSILCILAILQIPHCPVNVRKWKNKMLEGMDKKDKKVSIAKAKSLFPSIPDTVKDGQAEALLIAAYGASLGFAEKQ